MSSEQTSQSNEAFEAHQTDTELFLLVQNGQLDSLATLYDRHAPLVYGIALNLLNNAQEAEDLTQDIFLIISKKCSFNPQRGTIRTFLSVLTRSRAIDRLRSRARAQSHLNQQILHESTRLLSNTPIENIFQRERAQQVETAISQLSNQEQEVIKMAYYEGLSQSEIAARLDIAIGTIKSRSRRGLLKLRQALADFIEK
ncbi:sigma-70 family RNA polymerase sigma factor [Gloeocapsa sp. PCC 73106]|uniref:sigma-70 family RNA polymerase sigma factor n=1 Tax=Gloeocapsa sp. PCC 73106 TaxID=102232 RepID=UPI0002ABF39C|nr:sigma-70 family RNA polymerase sigma factor [Gloeocapsa sp. PCC 73106]ELR96961.1 RNA polymerase sigma factor, sigma-70 family [Gloeocapsa sp. PCC 73106]